MTIIIECSGCRNRLRVPNDSAGRRGKCRKCGAPIVIPPVGDEFLQNADIQNWQGLRSDNRAGTSNVRLDSLTEGLVKFFKLRWPLVVGLTVPAIFTFIVAVTWGSDVLFVVIVLGFAFALHSKYRADFAAKPNRSEYRDNQVARANVAALRLFAVLVLLFVALGFGVTSAMDSTGAEKDGPRIPRELADLGFSSDKRYLSFDAGTRKANHVELLLSDLGHTPRAAGFVVPNDEAIAFRVKMDTGDRSIEGRYHIHKLIAHVGDVEKLLIDETAHDFANLRVKGPVGAPASLQERIYLETSVDGAQLRPLRGSDEYRYVPITLEIEYTFPVGGFVDFETHQDTMVLESTLFVVGPRDMSLFEQRFAFVKDSRSKAFIRKGAKNMRHCSLAGIPVSLLMLFFAHRNERRLAHSP